MLEDAKNFIGGRTPRRRLAGARLGDEPATAVMHDRILHRYLQPPAFAGAHTIEQRADDAERHPGFSPWEAELPRDADSLLEGRGFEPSVPYKNLAYATFSKVASARPAASVRSTVWRASPRHIRWRVTLSSATERQTRITDNWEHRAASWRATSSARTPS